MSTILEDYVNARHDVELAVARLRVADLSLADPHASMVAVNLTLDAVTVAARTLTRAAEALPMDRQRQIRGWVEPATVNPEARESAP
jgi:hypothetical protein